MTTKEPTMRKVMIRYRLNPDQVERNEELVRAVYEELHRAAPSGYRYATFKLEDGVTFVQTRAATGEHRDGEVPAALPEEGGLVHSPAVVVLEPAALEVDLPAARLPMRDSPALVRDDPPQ
jgi:hypothetical protein